MAFLWAAFLLSLPAAAQPMNKPAPPRSPASAGLPPLEAPQRAANGVIRAQLRPVQHTDLASEMAGKIIELPVREGDRFRQGARLVAFDCSVYRAQLAHSQAAENAALVKMKSSDQLATLGGISNSDVAQARSQHAMASAESAGNRAMVQRCTIAAPFSGRVTAVRAQRWSSVPAGQPLLEIYDDRAFNVEMIVPSMWLAWLKPGYGFNMRVDETAREYPARITRISGSVDPVSQTVKVFGEIGAQEGLLPGMSGTALIVPPGKPAANVRR
jgi:membrane fusion protein, multidrug efflux system